MHFLPNCVMFKYPQYWRALKYHKQTYNDTIKHMNWSLGKIHLEFFVILLLLHKSDLSSFLVLAMLGQSIWTSLSSIKLFYLNQLIISKKQQAHSFYTSTDYIFEIIDWNTFMFADSNWYHIEIMFKY